jgi:hypothetical protein
MHLRAHLLTALLAVGLLTSAIQVSAQPIPQLRNDLGGTAPNPTVVGLQNHALPAPTGTNTVPTWSGTALSWTVPGGSGSSTTGIGLWYNATSGVLNGASVTLGGAISLGTLSGTTIPVTLSSTGVSAGTYGSTTTIPQYTVGVDGRLTASSGLSLAAAGLPTITVTGDAQGSGSGGTIPTLVFALTGNGSTPIAMTPAMQWVKGATAPTITQATPTSDVATTPLTLTSQAPFASATVNTAPGDVVANVPLPAIAAPGNRGAFSVQENGVQYGAIGHQPVTTSTFGMFWLGQGVSRTSTNEALISDGSTATELNAPTSGTVAMAVGGAGVVTCTSSGCTVASLSGSGSQAVIASSTGLLSRGVLTLGQIASPTGTGVALVSGGAWVGAAGAVNLASSTYVSGLLAPANAGTGVTNPTAHAVAVAEGSSAFDFVSGTATSQYLGWNASGDPTFQAIPFSSITGSLSLSQIAQGGATSSQVLEWNGTAWTPASLPAGSSVTGTGFWYSASGALNGSGVDFSGDATFGPLSGGNVPITLATVNSNTGACGDATHVCQVTLNGKGLATAATAVSITAPASGISGIVAAANGGTGTASPTAHSSPVAEGSSAYNFVGPGTSAQLYLGQGATSDPAWESMSGDCTIGATGTITCAKINGTSVPAGGALTTGNQLIVSSATAATWTALNLAGGSGYVAGILPVANGGTNLSTLTAHNVVLGEGTGSVAFAAPGTSGTVLVSGGASVDPTFGTLTNSSLAAGSFANITGVGTLTAGSLGSGFTLNLSLPTITNVLAAANGGTGSSGPGGHTVPISPTAGATYDFVFPGAAGLVLTSNGTGSDPSFQAPSGGVTWANDLAGSTSSDQWVAAISGNAGGGGTIPIAATPLQFTSATTTPAINQAALASTSSASGSAGQAMALTAMAGQAATGASHNGGAGGTLNVSSGAGGTSGSATAGAAGPLVLQVGGTNELALNAGLLAWDKAVTSPTIFQTAPASDVATTNTTLQAQGPFGSATTNKVAGNLNLNIPASISGTSYGYIKLQYNNVDMLQIGAFPGATTTAAWWPSGVTPSSTNYLIAANATAFAINNPVLDEFGIANTYYFTISSTADTFSRLAGTGSRPVIASSTGVLSAANLTVGQGGTGGTTLTLHGPLFGEGTSAIAAAAAGTSGQPLLSGGASADGAYGLLNVSSAVTGVLAVANGGTGSSTGPSWHVTTFCASGCTAASGSTYTTGSTLIEVGGCGAGGGGGGSYAGSLTGTNSSPGGGGGGAAQYRVTHVSISPAGTSLTITDGTAATGGAAGSGATDAGNGLPGGTSTVALTSGGTVLVRWNGASGGQGSGSTFLGGVFPPGGQPSTSQGANQIQVLPTFFMIGHSPGEGGSGCSVNTGQVCGGSGFTFGASGMDADVINGSIVGQGGSGGASGATVSGIDGGGGGGGGGGSAFGPGGGGGAGGAGATGTGGAGVNGSSVGSTAFCAGGGGAGGGGSAAVTAGAGAVGGTSGAGYVVIREYYRFLAEAPANDNARPLPKPQWRDPDLQMAGNF